MENKVYLVVTFLWMKWIWQYTGSPHIETRQLICEPNQLISFYKRSTRIFPYSVHTMEYKDQIKPCIFLHFNPFHGTGLFLYPLKTSENQRFSDVLGSIERDHWHQIG